MKKVTFPESFVMDEIVLQKLSEGQKYAAAVVVDVTCLRHVQLYLNQLLSQVM